MIKVPRKRSSRAATLADVGRLAGVSAMAASAVLNGARTSSRISAETREKILLAAAELKYRPNVAARALANRRMNTIGVAAVVENSEFNFYFLEAFNGIIEAAARYGQNTTVFTLHDWAHDVSRLSDFCDGRIDGLILIGPVLTPDAAAKLPHHTPFVSLHPNLPIPGVVSVETDEERGAYDMVEYLLSLGHRRILHLSAKRGLLGAERRIQGWRRAMADYGVPEDPNMLVEAHYSVSQGRLAMESWLSRNTGQPLPHSVFCASDAIAIGAMEALAARSIRVPEDVSVAGFDDSLAARLSIPQLASVRQPLRLMGNRSVDLLMERISHSLSAGQLSTNETPVIFGTELVIRSSIGAPAGTNLPCPPDPRLV